MRERIIRLKGWCTQRTIPRADGLPNALVLWWFPTVVTMLFLGAVLADVSGSSTGVWWTLTHHGKDPNLLMGTPRAIRSDEWLVQGTWMVSEHAQGFASTNAVFPGGMDATVMNDVPTWDWSTLFRPQLWGSLVLGLGHGLAFRWWLQAWAILVPAYAFVVSLLPRRPVVGALVAGLVIFQPMLQWWWFPATTLPVAFAFTTMTAVVWAVRTSSRRGRILSASAAAYSAVAMAMSIYAPYMLAVFYPTLAFAVGYLLNAWRGGVAVRELGRRLIPLVAGGIAAGLIVGVWAVTRWSTVQALFATVYPGQRLTPPGQFHRADLVSTLSGPFLGVLRHGDVVGLGGNQSEAAVPVAISLFLVLPMLWLVWARWHRLRQIDWLAVLLVAVQMFVLAYQFIPGWDQLSRLLLVDRSVPQRMRLGFVVLDASCLVAVAMQLRELRVRTAWWATALTGLVAAGSTAWTWRRLDDVGSSAVGTFSLAVAIALVAGLLLLARRHVLAGVVMLTVCTLAVGIDVNPLYRGIFDTTTQTSAGRAVSALHAQEPTARWVGVGSFLPMATVFEAGVPAYSGVQTYPALTMWHQIDPSGSYEQAWNRLAHVMWSAGNGDPSPRQPAGAPDVIQLTFDSCAPFAQSYVTYVLSDGPIDQGCLDLVKAFPHQVQPEWIYRVARLDQDKS